MQYLIGFLCVKKVNRATDWIQLVFMLITTNGLYLLYTICHTELVEVYFMMSSTPEASGEIDL